MNNHIPHADLASHANLIDREYCERLDISDRLAECRKQFVLPAGVAYFDGMSLGALPKIASDRVAAVIESQWGEGLVRSWNTAGWIEMPQRIGGKIAPLLGADADEVVVADSTSVNLFKLLVAALRLRPDRRVIVIESSNFPTDIYIARGVEELHPGVEVKIVPGGQVDHALDDKVAVVMLTHVDFKTAEIHNMAKITARAHDAGAIVLWDLSHSTGAVPLDLHGCDADLAVGCGYKYLNGGPGAPAFMFVARHHQEQIDQPITAWMGHAKPFDFDLNYTPAQGVKRLLSGTPMIVSLAAMEAGLDIWNQVDLHSVREKSIAMSELFVRIVAQRSTDPQLKLASPSDPKRRGGHLAFQHPQGYAVMQALIDRGVIGDFRDPDLMRFGFAPLYLRFADVWTAANALVEVVETNAWDHPRFRERAAVT